MSSPRSTWTRICGGGLGLLVVLAWLVAPALHLWPDEAHGECHHHDEASCAICQVAFHSAADGVRPAPLVRRATAQNLAYAEPLTLSRSAAPDLRAHGPQGPPSA